MTELDNVEVVKYYLRTKTGMFLEKIDGRIELKLTERRDRALSNCSRHQHEILRDELYRNTGFELFLEEYVVTTRSDFSLDAFTSSV